MPADASRINHITDELLATADPFPTVAEAIINMINNIATPQDIVVFFAHNGEKFDKPILADEFINNDTPIPDNWRFADTLPMFRAIFPNAGPKNSRPYSLESLHNKFFHAPISNNHRALGDVLALESCLRHAIPTTRFTIHNSVQKLLPRQNNAS